MLKDIFKTKRRKEYERVVKELTEYFLVQMYIISRQNGGYLTRDVEDYFERMYKLGLITEKQYKLLTERIKFYSEEESAKIIKANTEELLRTYFGEKDETLH